MHCKTDLRHTDWSILLSVLPAVWHISDRNVGSVRIITYFSQIRHYYTYSCIAMHFGTAIPPSGDRTSSLQWHRHTFNTLLSSPSVNTSVQKLSKYQRPHITTEFSIHCGKTYVFLNILVEGSAFQMCRTSYCAL
jgi:hypothetical protein